MMANNNVRFGSEADMCAAKSDVRFTPNSDHKSEFPHKVMSALPPRATAKAIFSQGIMSALPPTADMCSATADVCFGPIADIATANGKNASRTSR